MTSENFVPLRAAVDRDARRARVVALGTVNGIDFIETLGDRKTLRVRLFSTLGTDQLGTSTVKITREGSAAPVPVQTVTLVNAADDSETVLEVIAARPGDTAPHYLHLVAADGSAPPAGFDPVLCEMPFSFYPETAADPRATRPAEPDATTVAPFTDYLARDAEALRTRLTDRFAALVPGWDDRNPADPAVMMLELFAALGDRLAYWQDAVGTEAYLGTARRRASVRRHARLLDYHLGEGCAARVWLACATPRSVELRAGTPVADRPLPPGSTAADAVAAGAVVFQTRTSKPLTPARTAIELYAWGDPEHELPAGSRSAYLVLPADGPGPDLRRDDLLILADLPPDPESAAEPGTAGPLALFARSLDGDPALRFAVRLDTDPVVRTDPLAALPICPGGDPRSRRVLEIQWAADDALPRALPVTERGPGGGPVARAVALANVVLADEGASLPPEPLLPDAPTPGVPFRPRLRSGVPAWTDRSDPGTDGRSAQVRQSPDPLRAVPALILNDGRRDWDTRRDLLGSGRADPHVVVEPDGRGGASLRFGDGIHGRVPDSQVPMVAEYRIGGGARGNVAAGRLVTVLAALPNPAGEADPFGGAAESVWNPLPAVGGADPEDVDRARRLAPAGLRHQERAVTSADYAAAAEKVEGVQRAAAWRRWTGSWFAQQVTVDPRGAEELPPELAQRVADRLEGLRMAGTDVAVAAPTYAALSIELTVYVRPGYTQVAVEERVRDAVSARNGFFHPDRLTFGQSVYLSDLVVTVADVPGVDRVDVIRFARSADSPAAAAEALEAAVIPIRPLEVARCDSDPDRLDRGNVELKMVGGV